jgi:branched-chain amino acid transport system substrate-binding protein
VSEETFGGERVSRRGFLVRAGSSGLALASSGSLLAACGGVKQSGSSGGGAGTITVGYVSPQTGPAAGFGETDQWLLGVVRKALDKGVKVGNKTYDVKILVKDSASNPQRAAAVANELINKDGIDLMLASSTPESVNPVSDACEAAGVPCISTVVPWQAWYYGRGAKPSDKAAFKYTYHFSFGVENFATTYISQWHQLPTNKTVGALLPNDSDGNAIRQSLLPILKKAGFTIVDPGPYEDGTNDFSAQIAKYKSSNCEIFVTFPLPPDFATFWKQAAQQGYKPKIAQIAKTGLFPSQVEALGSLGPGLSSGAFWHPVFPYASSLTGLKGKAIQNSYESESGRQWTQVLGTGLALFDAGAAALKASTDPKDKAALTKAISTLKVDTPVGHLDWTKGPVKNAVHTIIPGCQWVTAKPGSKFKVDLLMTEHADDKNVPIQAKLKPYGSSV